MKKFVWDPVEGVYRIYEWDATAERYAEVAPSDDNNTEEGEKK